MSETGNESEIVGLSLAGGEIRELAAGTVGPSSDRIEQVIIPASVPWESDVQLYEAPLTFAGAEERSMGSETVWIAEYRGTIPNGGGDFSVEAVFMEYPANQFQLVEVNEDEAASFAQFDPGDLRPYVLANR